MCVSPHPPARPPHPGLEGAACIPPPVRRCCPEAEVVRVPSRRAACALCPADFSLLPSWSTSNMLHGVLESLTTLP